MVRSIMFFVLIAVLTCGTVQAQGKGFGLGIIVGEPTRNKYQAVDGKEHSH